MSWADSVHAVLPADRAEAAVHAVRAKWSGARIYITLAAARLEWKRPSSGPSGAVEMFASDLARAIEASGGTASDATRVLLPLAGTHVVI